MILVVATAIKLRIARIAQGQLQSIYNIVLGLMRTMMFQIDENIQKQAADLFAKTEKLIKQDVQTIVQWMETQPHLPEIMEEVKIKNFLILNKYSIEKTKQKIDLYYSIRTLIPDVFANSNPESAIMQDFMDTTYCCVHPKPFDQLYRVYFLKAKTVNKLSPKEVGVQCSNIAEVRLYEDCMVGDVIIFDMRTVTFSDLTKVNPVLMTKLISIYKVFSMRVKQVYIINSPSYVANLLAVLKSVVKPKIFTRIQVCKDDSILSEVFSKNDLPKDYGGLGPSLDELNEQMKLQLAQYQSRFDLLDTLKVNETLRPAGLNNDEILGFYGNFKKLDVD